MQVGTMEMIKGRSGAWRGDTELHVYARTAQYHTGVFTRRNDGQEVPLFAITLGDSVGTHVVAAPYVLTPDGSGLRVDCEGSPEFWCAVPARMLPTGEIDAALDPMPRATRRIPFRMRHLHLPDIFSCIDHTPTGPSLGPLVSTYPSFGPLVSTYPSFGPPASTVAPTCDAWEAVALSEAWRHAAPVDTDPRRHALDPVTETPL